MLQPVTASGLLPPFLADATCISKQLSPNLQQGNAAGAVLHTARHCDKTLRQDTAVRHYGKAIRQALRKDSPEDTADTCGKAQRQNTAAGITARRHHDKTLRQKYTAALWQESATCGKKVRHATATKPKKEGVGGGVHDALRVLVISYGNTPQEWFQCTVKKNCFFLAT